MVQAELGQRKPYFFSLTLIGVKFKATPCVEPADNFELFSPCLNHRRSLLHSGLFLKAGARAGARSGSPAGGNQAGASQAASAAK